MTDKRARVWNGTEWIDISSPIGVPNSIAVFQSEPPLTPGDGQIWVNSDTTVALEWPTIGIDEESLQGQIDIINNDKQNLIPYQDLEPESPNEGDLWVNSLDDPPTLNIYDGSSWISTGSSINLAAYEGSINPSTTNTYDLGTSSLRWRNIYTQDLHLSNGIGDYTVIEGEEDLFIVNNKNGKSYKFMLTEVSSSEVPPKSKNNFERNE
jgi:hypothetical protein